MSDKLREAIEFVRTFKGAQQSHAIEHVFEQYAKVAGAYLTEHPADDETLVNVAWVEKVSPKGWQTDRNGNSEIWIGPARWHDFPSGGVLLIDHGAALGWELRTRGDVRRLCRALRVDLGDQR